MKDVLLLMVLYLMLTAGSLWLVLYIWAFLWRHILPAWSQLMGV